jgi:hypothetical protein
MPASAGMTGWGLGEGRYGRSCPSPRTSHL